MRLIGDLLRPRAIISSLDRTKRATLMRIVTNADDFGLDADTTAATIECFRAGALTSASIMPNMPATDQAVEFTLQNPQHSFGVHLTFVCDTVEAPISAPEMLPAM